MIRLVYTFAHDVQKYKLSRSRVNYRSDDVFDLALENVQLSQRFFHDERKLIA